MKCVVKVCHMVIEMQKNRRELQSTLYSANNKHWKKLKKEGTSKKCEDNASLKEIEPEMGI